MKELLFYKSSDIPDKHYKKMFGIKSICKEMRSEKLYREDCDEWCIIVEEGELLSFLGLQLKNDVLWIKHIYVYPENRGRGLYKDMLSSSLKKYSDKVAMASCVEASRKEMYNQGFIRVTEGKYKNGYYMVKKTQQL